MARKSAKTSISPTRPDLTDEDIYEAMKKIPGYLDITPGDFKELYVLAYDHAMERLTASIRAQARQICQ